jgi:L-lactate dehydrogenase complex protein LldF
MAKENITFNQQAEKVAFDKEHRRKINFNIDRYEQSFVKGKERYAKLELARQRAYNVKYKSLYQLDKFLVEFETNFTRNGGKVIWAQDHHEAVKAILKLFEQNKVTKVVKSKSMTTEELHLNDALQQKKIEAIETDLGEFIVQLAGEKPYHIVTPAMHKSREDVSDLFNKKFGLAEGSKPEAITAFARKKLRNDFIEAQAGITGANFLLADIGGIALTENEGNGLMSMAFPGLHVVVAGIEKIIPGMDDLDLFWPLLATHGTGQAMTVYNSIITGPVRENEGEGPNQMVVVLVDNGRTQLLSKARQRIALGCIRCGACLNVCPVYKNIGGYTYDTTYSGPIGSVITPHLSGMKQFRHLSTASSLCGQCTEVCPVKIPLHELLLLNRSDAVKEGYPSFGERFMVKTTKKIMLNRSFLDMFGSTTKNLVVRYFMSKSWGNRRKMPEFAPKSFNKLWKETEGNAEKIQQKRPGSKTN